jgi:hypothetical protein
MKRFNGQALGVLALNVAIILDVLAKSRPPLLGAVLLTGALTTALLGAKLLAGAPRQ